MLVKSKLELNKLEKWTWVILVNWVIKPIALQKRLATFPEGLVKKRNM